MELLSVLILTRNEEVHIERCLLSAQRVAFELHVLDSKSTDKTINIAQTMGAKTLSVEFSSFSEKLNWALTHMNFNSEWVLRLDADEVLSETFVANVKDFLSTLNPDVNGVLVKRQLCFMGAKMRHGGVYPTYSMRLWRPGTTVCETRKLDEHMILLSGRSSFFDADIVDDPLTGVSEWITKHNKYSTLEAETALAKNDENEDTIIKSKLFGTAPQRIRWCKLYLYYNVPLLIRPILYFLYRYIVRLGFLDGQRGFIFHFMHSLWYRLLVDAKILEMRSRIKVKN